MPEDREMPEYKCHKTVHALKISHIAVMGAGDGLLTSPDDDYGEFRVSKDYMDRHKPEVGGYFIIYDDEYESYSPQAAFENGYTRI